MRGVRAELAVVGLSVLVWAGCATGSSAQEQASGEQEVEEAENRADCVITDPQGSEVQIRHCYVETGPEGVAESVRIPIVETTTETPAGEFTYPLKFELEVTDKGKMRIIGPIRRREDSEGQDESAPAQSPSMEENRIDEDQLEGSPDGEETEDTNDDGSE